MDLYFATLQLLTGAQTMQKKLLSSSVTEIQNQLLTDQLSVATARSIALEVALKNYIDEAHYKCLDGLTECDHLGGVCYCTYHEALRRAQSLIRSR